jgi:hypothetical protein
MSTKSKYRVQSNAFVVDKSKEAKKSIFKKPLPCAWAICTVKVHLCRALGQNAR